MKLSIFLCILAALVLAIIVGTVRSNRPLIERSYKPSVNAQHMSASQYLATINN